MYQMNEISNRDVSLLHYYRILRQPSDFLSAIYCDDEPVMTEIYQGISCDFMTEDNRFVYEFDLGIELKEGKIPYLEFDTDNDADRKRLEALLYLDNISIYGVISKFEKPVEVKIYWVSSLDDIRKALDRYREAIYGLNLDDLRNRFEDRKNQPKALENITGRHDNLVEFTEGKRGLTMKDSDYMIATALSAQLLVNPSQELLMSLPRKLKHNINIAITDRKTRYLASFSGYTINIRGNGSWVIRDVDSGIDFTKGSGSVYLWNCSIVHFRNSVEKTKKEKFNCKYLHAHRSLIVVNQGVLDDATLTGGSTLAILPVTVPMSENEDFGIEVKKISYVGCGCSVYSWLGTVPVLPSAILGLVRCFNAKTHSNSLYIAGRRIDEVSCEHDAELNPSRIVEYNAGNIHIYQEGD